MVTMPAESPDLDEILIRGEAERGANIVIRDAVLGLVDEEVRLADGGAGLKLGERKARHAGGADLDQSGVGEQIFGLDGGSCGTPPIG